jgi:hypothetical protein
MGSYIKSRRQKFSPRRPGGSGRSEAAKNEIFNITNGDYFRWKYLWPRIAAMFDMPAADPIPTPLTVYMADKKPAWEAIVRKHGLQPLSYEQVSSWSFADAILRLMEYDNIRAPLRRAALVSTTASIRRRCAKVSSPTSAKNESFRSFADSMPHQPSNGSP